MHVKVEMPSGADRVVLAELKGVAANATPRRVQLPVSTTAAPDPETLAVDDAPATMPKPALATGESV